MLASIKKSLDIVLFNRVESHGLALIGVTRGQCTIIPNGTSRPSVCPQGVFCSLSRSREVQLIRYVRFQQTRVNFVCMHVAKEQSQMPMMLDAGW